MRIEIRAVGRLRAGPEKTLLDDYLARAGAAGRSLGITSLTFAEVEEKRRLDGAALMLYDPTSDAVSPLIRAGTGALFDIRGDGSVFSSIDNISAAIPDASLSNTHDPLAALADESVAVRLQFHNGMTGIYTISVPEPTSLLPLAAAATLLLRRRQTHPA